MSPEQMRSTARRGRHAPTSGRWGSSSIELVTGVPPSTATVCPRSSRARPTRSRPRYGLASRSPPLFEVAILRCLEKDRQKRYASVGELAIDLGPFATRVGRNSVENIRRTLQMSTATMATVLAAPAAPAAREGARTIEPLGQTQVPMRGASGKTILTAFAIGIVVLIGVIGVRMLTSSSPAKPASIAQLPTAATPSPVAIAPVAPDPTPSTPIAIEPVPTAAPTSSSQAPAAKKAQPAVGAKAPPKPKANCDPNFFLDAQGERHFKPECFR